MAAAASDAQPSAAATSHRVAMDTLVTIEAVGGPSERTDERIAKAFAWFAEVEACCSRFDPASELSRLCDQPGTAVRVSPLLFRAIEFALAVAERSGGAFDPTVGDAMARAGFTENYQTGATTGARSAALPSFRDVALDPATSEVTLGRSLTLDLGAVAKGLAIDLAAQELRGLEGFAINAGGDIYAEGRNHDGTPWAIGIRHPRELDALAETFAVSGAAVCTSGDYERTSTSEAAHHHILDPSSGRAASGAASVTVIAPSAMLADALATAAFVLGPERGIAFLEEQGVEGLIITPGLERFETTGLQEFIA